MAKKQILIRFELGEDENSIIHRVRNLGEDLYRELHVKGIAQVSDPDIAIDELKVKISKKNKYGEVSQLIDRLLKEHKFLDSTTIISS